MEWQLCNAKIKVAESFMPPSFLDAEKHSKNNSKINTYSETVAFSCRLLLAYRHPKEGR